MRERGYTLVSVTMAMVLAAMLAITFFSGASNDTRNELLSRSYLVAHRLNSAVTTYYDARCQSGVVASPSVADLVAGGILQNSSVVAFPAGGVLESITINKSANTPALFKYKVRFLSQGDAAIAAGGKLNAVAAGRFVTWTLVNHSNSESAVSEGDEYLRAFGGTSC